MSVSAKVISGLALTALALALWRFTSGPAEDKNGAQGVAPASVASGVATLPPKPNVASGDGRVATPLATVLNERTLVGSKWQREGFGIEFSADGKLLIGGRQRARWRVEGSRVRLYRDATPSGGAPEEHWLDIVGNKLMWEGQEIGRVR